MKIYPALLSSSLDEIYQQLVEISNEALENPVQIDIIDGEFTPVVTITPADLAEFDLGQLQLDFHLMTNEPMDYVWEIFDYQAQLPTRAIIAQIEHMSDIPFFCEQVGSKQLLPGISLDLYTPLEEIEASWFASGLKIIQLLGVPAGAQGQTFHEKIILEKIAELKANFGDLILAHQVEVCFDGGLNPEKVSLIVNSFPSSFHPLLSFAVGSYLQKEGLASGLAQFSEYSSSN